MQNSMKIKSHPSLHYMLNISWIFQKKKFLFCSFLPCWRNKTTDCYSTCTCQQDSGYNNIVCNLEKAHSIEYMSLYHTYTYGRIRIDDEEQGNLLFIQTRSLHLSLALSFLVSLSLCSPTRPLTLLWDDVKTIGRRQEKTYWITATNSRRKAASTAERREVKK